MYDLLLAFLKNLNDLLTAGIAITAFSLLLYALSFNLRDRVARSFAFIMLCIVIIYVSESLSSFITSFQQVEFLLRVQWIGIAFLPPAYLHLSDAILETTGRPSRGRRRNAVRLVYLISLAFLIGLPFSVLVGPLVSNNEPPPYLTLTWMSIVFTVFYVIVMSVSWINLWRAMKRTKATASRRRMIYLLVGSLAPALGSYPYLLVGFNFAAAHPLIFWVTVNTFNILVSVFLVLMAYAVAYFGVPWPDRVVKRRLFKWLLRGPVTASTTLALTTFLSRVSAYFNIDISPLIPAVMVTSIVSIEHLITLTAPTFERWLFRERSQSEMELLQSLEDRLLTIDDLQQFLEAVLSAVCDRLQTQNAFIATLNTSGVELFITTSSDSQLEIEPPTAEMLQEVSKNGFEEELFTWGDYWLIPLFDQEQDAFLLGIIGIQHNTDLPLDEEQTEALVIFTERTAMALRDRRKQQQAFSLFAELTPQMDLIQNLRASARYDDSQVLSPSSIRLEDKTFSGWVKDALSHYWGGPKLTGSPLMRLKIVQQSLEQYDENPTNTLRAVLRQAIDQVRPEGERRFTGEWILYNILEMKFMEGRKVRDIAMRLAMSEADLYRKQRVAIQAVADVIVAMEQDARQEAFDEYRDNLVSSKK
jgi:hypothetical protein